MAFELVPVPKVVRTAEQRQQDRAARRAERQDDPNGIAAEKRKADAAEERYRRSVCALVMKRSQFCEVCGDTEAETAQKSIVGKHEVHEVVARSLTRNQEMTKRFSAANCARVCRPCHDGLGMRVGGRKCRIVFHDDVRGMAGDYDVVAMDGHVIRSMRRGIDAKPQHVADSLISASRADALPQEHTS